MKFHTALDNNFNIKMQLKHFFRVIKFVKYLICL